MGASVVASATASAKANEEVAENAGGGSASVGTEIETEHSAASVDLGGDNLAKTALQGMGGGPTAEPSIVAPMPGVWVTTLLASRAKVLIVAMLLRREKGSPLVLTVAVLWLLLWKCPRTRQR